MDIRNIQSFLGSAWGVISAGTVFFPFFDQVTNIVYVPAIGEDKGVVLLLNSLICSFFLLFFFLVQDRYKNLVIPLVLFGAGTATFLWYEHLVSPILALHRLGIAADISYLTNYPEIFYRMLYWVIFAAFTGAFTSIGAFFYRSRSSIYMWG